MGYSKEESCEIVKAYRDLLKPVYYGFTRAEQNMVHKAFKLAAESHKEQRRRSGEPYIFHPISVAKIVSRQMGLGAKSVTGALLHDVVEDTDVTLEDIEKEFSPQIAQIVDGLTKISGISDTNISMQAENFRKMLLTISNDIRVVLIKIADRLHNMSTMDAMIPEKQKKIAQETLYIYAPIAHRLGMYNIKSRMEDLALKYTEPQIYNQIVQKLIETEAAQDKYIENFINSVKDILKKEKIEFEITGRTKSIYSIYKKMTSKNIPFEEVFDRFAIRIVYKCPEEQEKFTAWKIYSIVTDKYRPNPSRLRDWISSPKTSGYEALHITVMGPEAKWVEVQIRSERMNELAERGYAAHYKYKYSREKTDSVMDEWVFKVRETLENAEFGAAADLVNEFKLNLLVGEIYVFTPKGDIRSLPKGATALDFAFAIHSVVGSSCLGAKVNGKLVPFNHILQNGDQVEIITGKNQKPKPNWLEYVITTKARNRIRAVLSEEVKNRADYGRELLERKMKHLKLEVSEQTINELASYLKCSTSQDLFLKIEAGEIDNAELKQFVNSKGFLSNLIKNTIGRAVPKQISSIKKEPEHLDRLVFGDNEDAFEYKLAPCCNPSVGDEVFGFVTVGKGITVHRRDCLNAHDIRKNYGYRVLKAKWVDSTKKDTRITLEVSGLDAVGLVNKLTKIISEDMNLNMDSINISSKAGMFYGEFTVHILNKKDLKELVDKIKLIEDIKSVNIK